MRTVLSQDPVTNLRIRVPSSAMEPMALAGAHETELHPRESFWKCFECLHHQNGQGDNIFTDKLTELTTYLAYIPE
jgi:hypothetical protein